MKKILLSLLAGATMLLGSCDKESAENFAPTTDATTFTVGVAELQTRATSTITPPRYIMEVYDATGTTAQEVIKNADGVLVSHCEIGSGTFSAYLDKTKTYTCLFWADGSAAGTQSGVYDAASLKTVKLNTDKVATEAYYAKVDVAEGKNPTVSVTLKRAVAKITLVETAAVEVGKQISVTYANNTSFNALDSTAGTPTTDYTSTITTVADKLTGALGEFYMLASAGGATLDMSIRYDAGDAKSLTNVPVKQNYNTNIKGEFSNLVSKTFTVTADDTWETPDINKPIDGGITISATPGVNGAPVYEITNAAGLKAFADLINGAGTAYEVDGIEIPATSTPEARKSNVILKTDINLADIAGNWVPIGKSDKSPYTGAFNGNGHTITGLEMVDTNAADSYWGLCGFTKDAILYNIHLRDVNINVKSSKALSAGAISGHSTNSTFSLCSITGSVSTENTNGEAATSGGLAGGGDNCHITGSWSECVLKAKSPDNTDVRAGGLTGFAERNLYVSCYTINTVVVTEGRTSYSGGITGYSGWTNNLLGCYADSPKLTGGNNRQALGANRDKHFSCYATNTSVGLGSGADQNNCVASGATNYSILISGNKGIDNVRTVTVSDNGVLSFTPRTWKATGIWGATVADGVAPKTKSEYNGE